MKRIITLIVICLMATAPVLAQKIVIGSRMPDIRADKIEWLTPAPPKGKAILIDFFSINNPSSVKEYSKLANIHKTLGSKLGIVIILAVESGNLRNKVAADGSRYIFGLDIDGDIFTLFGVRYLPFYMLFNAKGEMVWQGNISTLTTTEIEELL